MEIKKIITEKAFDEVEHWFETKNGVKLYLPYRFDSRVNLEAMEYVSGFDIDVANYPYPTISELIKEGVLSDIKFPYTSCDKNYKSYPSHFYHSGKTCNVKEIQKYFEKNCGIKVSEDAIMHNFNAWMLDMKSGYRDEENGYHLFTPCGCNPLSFRLTTLHKASEDWQETYIC